MNFTEAIEAMKQGKKVTHSRLTECGECNPLYIYIYYDKETSKYQFYGEVYEGDYLFNAVDVDATDWEIYKPEPALNPCGVCGDAHYAHSRIEGGTYVECSCGIRTSGVFGTLEEAARIWNKAHQIAEPNKEITVGDWIFFKTADGKTRCAKVEKVCDDYVVTSFCDVLKNDIIGKAVVAMKDETKKAVTNYDKVFLPWVKKNPDLKLCNYKSKFVLRVRDNSCPNTSCEECDKRFIAHLQEEYKEVKE